MKLKFMYRFFYKRKLKMLFNKERKNLASKISEELKSADDQGKALELGFLSLVFKKSRISEIYFDLLSDNKWHHKVIPSEVPNFIECFILDLWIITYSYERFFQHIDNGIVSTALKNAHEDVVTLLPLIGWHVDDIVKLMKLHSIRYEQYNLAIEKSLSKKPENAFEFPDAVLKNVFLELKYFYPIFMLHVFIHFSSEILSYKKYFKDFDINSKFS